MLILNRFNAEQDSWVDLTANNSRFQVSRIKLSYCILYAIQLMKASKGPHTMRIIIYLHWKLKSYHNEICINHYNPVIKFNFDDWPGPAHHCSRGRNR